MIRGVGFNGIAAMIWVGVALMMTDRLNVGKLSRNESFAKSKATPILATKLQHGKGFFIGPLLLRV